MLVRLAYLALVLTFHSQIVSAAMDGGWSAPDPGLLRDATFDAKESGERPAWGASQHAGETSYRFHFESGVLRIQRIGPEPWGQVRHRIDAEALVGRTLEFSAELSGNFSASGQRQTSTTGLGVQVLGYKAGIPRIAGKRTLYTAEGEPSISPYCIGWTPQSVRFDVPAGATDILLSIRLGMYGTLSVRGPRLVGIKPVKDEAKE